MFVKIKTRKERACYGELRPTFISACIDDSMCLVRFRKQLYQYKLAPCHINVGYTVAATWTGH